MTTIRTRLLIGLMSGVAVCMLAASVLLYSRADHEADEQSDQRLRELASWLPLQAEGRWRLPPEEDDDGDDRFYVEAWNAAGARVYDSQGSPELPFSQPPGYVTVMHSGERWRVYADVISGYHVQVSQPIAARQRIAAHMALRIAPPLLLLLPAMAGLIWIVVGRADSTMMRLARWMASSTSCVISTTVWRSCSRMRSSSLRMRRCSSASGAEKGSSM